MRALGTGTAYAADAVFSTDIVDGEVEAVDLADDSVTTTKVLVDSLTSEDLASNSVGSSEIATSAVGYNEIAGNAIKSSQVYPDALFATDLAVGSVSSSEARDESLTLDDIVGANALFTISYNLAANSCQSLSLHITGAKVTQAALMTFTKSVNPGTVVFQPLRVTGFDTGTVRACNVGSTAASVSGLGVRVATFGG